MRLWTLNLETQVFFFTVFVNFYQKITYEDFQLGSTRRIVTKLEVDPLDERMYCATQSGDVLDVRFWVNSLFKSAG